MKTCVEKKARGFRELNELALRGENVVFGSTYMAGFPFYELINKNCMDSAVYNRSIEGMTLKEAQAVLHDCVLSARPGKVFLALGDEDYADPDAPARYAAIVEEILAALPAARVYVVTLPIEAAGEFNRSILRLCDGRRVLPIELAPMECADATRYCAHFLQMSRCFREGCIGFAEAFALAGM